MWVSLSFARIIAVEKLASKFEKVILNCTIIIKQPLSRKEIETYSLNDIWRRLKVEQLNSITSIVNNNE